MSSSFEDGFRATSVERTRKTITVISPATIEGWEAHHDEFLGALEALGGSAGNGKLRELLGWYGAACEAVKAALLEKGIVVPGRGRGGSVAIAGADALLHGDNYGRPH